MIVLENKFKVIDYVLLLYHFSLLTPLIFFKDLIIKLTRLNFVIIDEHSERRRNADLDLDDNKICKKNIISGLTII